MSIVTMTLIMGLQAYWLFSQYQFDSDRMADALKPLCTEAIRQEQQVRHAHVQELRAQQKTKDTLKVNIRINIDRRKNGKSTTKTTFTYDMPGSKQLTYSGNTNDANDASIIYDRYIDSRQQPFQIAVFDSLMAAKGQKAATGFRRQKTTGPSLDPQYNLTGGWKKGLRVTYNANPLANESVSFVIPIAPSSVIRSMMWQLLASMLILAVLALCLAYQVKTIAIQKRIDAIRREFMKNMILEMKQPAEEGSETCSLRVGDTDFRYDLNELQHGNSRTLLTSRQTEIFRLLCENPNTTIPRSQILMTAWGDDSYANSMALNVQITYLRRAIKDDPKLSIEVVYKKGYVLHVET